MSNSLAHYRQLCRLLSPFTGETDRTELRHQAEQGAIDWEQVISIANQHLIGAALWSAVRGKGIDTYMPEEVCAYLEELRKLNRQRNEHLKRQAVEIVRALNAEGIEPLLIKGTAQLFHPVYPAFGDRIMNDLDIVVPQAAFDRALDTLYALQYTEAPDYPASHAPAHHWIPLVRDWEYGSVELHRDTVHQSIARVLPNAEVWLQSVAVQTQGTRLRIPCSAHALLINFLHAAMDPNLNAYFHIGLKGLADCAAITNTYGDRIEWSEIEHRIATNGLTTVWQNHRLEAKRLFGVSLPSRLRPGLAARLHTQISFAALRWPVVARFVHHLRQPLRVARSFSTARICQRYKCEPRIVPLTVSRLRLLFQHAFPRNSGHHEATESK